MSISSGKVWVNPKSDTVTFVMRPETPTTEMLEGNGLAMPAVPIAGIVMAPALAKVRVAAEAQTSSASVAARIDKKRECMIDPFIGLILAGPHGTVKS